MEKARGFQTPTPSEVIAYANQDTWEAVCIDKHS